MRVLQISSSRYFGGGERHVVDLCRGLTASGHEVFAVVAPDAAMRAELSFLHDGSIIELPFRGPLDISTARRIAAFTEAQKIDILHAHVARDYPVAALASRLASVPFVITRHVLFPMSRLHHFLLRGARFVIAPSNAVAKSLLDQRIFPDNKIVTIRHGLAPYKPVTRTRNLAGEFVVGTIGNLDPVKGFDVLIRAAALVLGEFPHVRFEVAGEDRESDKRNEHELRRLISTLGLEDRVCLTGWSADIHKTIAGFDLYVSASRSESFGYALADAILGGVPVVTTETEGAREVIGETNSPVPIGSPEALAERVIELIRDQKLRQTLADRAKQYVTENFGIDRMITETEAVYKRSVESS